MKNKILKYLTDWQLIYGIWIAITIYFALLLFVLIYLMDMEHGIAHADDLLIIILTGVGFFAGIIGVLTPVAAIYLLIKKQWLDSLLLFLLYPIPFFMSYIGSKLSYFIF